MTCDFMPQLSIEVAGDTGPVILWGSRISKWLITWLDIAASPASNRRMKINYIHDLARLKRNIVYPCSESTRLINALHPRCEGRTLRPILIVIDTLDLENQGLTVAQAQ